MEVRDIEMEMEVEDLVSSLVQVLVLLLLGIENVAKPGKEEGLV